MAFNNTPSSPLPKIKMATGLKSSLRLNGGDVLLDRNNSNPFEDENYGRSRMSTPNTQSGNEGYYSQIDHGRPAGVRLFSSHAEVTPDIPEANSLADNVLKLRTIGPSHQMSDYRTQAPKAQKWLSTGVSEDFRSSDYHPRSLSPTVSRKLDTTDTRDSTTQSLKDQKLSILHSMPKQVTPFKAGPARETRLV